MQPTDITTAIDAGHALVPAERTEIARGAASQTVPAMPWDELGPDTTVTLMFADRRAPGELPRTEETPEHLTIVNGDLAVRVPRDRVCDLPYPGPIAGIRAGNGPWTGSTVLSDMSCRGALETRIESVGSCCVQWRTVYRWGCDGQLVFRARWGAGADTIQIVEHITETAAGAICWHPFDDSPACSHVGGGGERPGPMSPLQYVAAPGAASVPGPRVLARLSHISYFNQWCQAWVAFTAARDDNEDLILGFFAGWAEFWQRRGHVRPEIIEDDVRGHILRCPVRRGQRCYGMVISRENLFGDGYTILNRRKRQLSDLRPAKTSHWCLDLPVPSRTIRLLADPVSESLSTRTIEEVCAAAERSWETVVNGGYEGLIIFDGRSAKSIAFDFDVLWARGEMDETVYRRVRGIFLLLAYAFADPDYCNYGDFWPLNEPDEGIAEALRDEMGDCPVPPNFASEFFSTAGVMAELFPDHPMANTWRTWAIDQTQLFLDTFFADDGTYHESINYHTHAVSEMICHWYPLQLHGHRDFFADPRVRGSFEHFTLLQMPFLQRDNLAPLPASGNSGGHGRPQPFRGELTVAAAVYRNTDPELAAQLMHAWHTGGKPGQDKEHPVLTTATLDTAITPRPAPWQSCHRQGHDRIILSFSLSQALLCSLFLIKSKLKHRS